MTAVAERMAEAMTVAYVLALDHAKHYRSSSFCERCHPEIELHQFFTDVFRGLREEVQLRGRIRPHNGCYLRAYRKPLRVEFPGSERTDECDYDPHDGEERFCVYG